MRKLIIGCGYLGERVAVEWLRQGDEIWALTRSEQNASRFEQLGIKPMIGDVLDPDSLKTLPAAETVLYAVGFDRGSQAAKRTVYVDGLRNALEEIRGRCKRFLYISSTSVYGQNAGEIVDECSETNPSEENGCICRDAEAVVWQHFHRAPSTHALSCAHASFEASGTATVLRLAGIYGPGRLLVRAEQLRRGVRLSGNPDAWLNLIHVDDAVRAILAAEAHGEPGETYLVSDNQPIRRRDYYAALAERIGAPVPQFEELAEDALEKSRFNKQCRNARLRNELGVELRYPSIIEGLRSLPEVTQSWEPRSLG